MNYLQDLAELCFAFHRSRWEARRKNPRAYFNPHAIDQYREALTRVQHALEALGLEPTKALPSFVSAAAGQAFEADFPPLKKFRKKHGLHDCAQASPNKLKGLSMSLASVVSLDAFRPNAAKASRPRLPSRTFRRHAARLRGKKALTKTEINALCSLLNGRKASACDELERRQLLELVDDRAERPITKEHSAQGLDWLRRTAFKLNGEPRLRCPFGEREQRIIKTFRRFAWVGLIDIGQPLRLGRPFRPVWRAFGAGGQYFDYYVVEVGGYRGVEITVL